LEMISEVTLLVIKNARSFCSSSLDESQLRVGLQSSGSLNDPGCEKYKLSSHKVDKVKVLNVLYLKSVLGIDNLVLSNTYIY
jgi:hypothetical protein